MPDAFWRLTFSEFHQLLRGHRRRAEQQWEHTRFLGSVILASVSGKDAPTPEQLVPLPIDAERAYQRQQAAAEAAAAAIAGKEAMLKRIAERNAKINAAKQANG